MRVNATHNRSGILSLHWNLATGSYFNNRHFAQETKQANGELKLITRNESEARG